MAIVVPLLVTLVAYLIGSVSFAVVVSRAMGLPDPRTFGSKNPGATNVLRTGKKTAAILTLLGDGAKGWFAVYLASYFQESPVVTALAAAAVILGHMYPVFHRFEGGKGVATACGALLALNLWLAAGVVSTWVIIAFFFRISSLAALIASASAPFYCFLLYGMHPYTAAVGAIAAMLVWRHKSNIKNLLAGTEGRIGEKNT
jgi:acyl phosphate:glycerol-3-phosphate acyltransferase